MPPRPRKSGYLPSLDGWRALAIVGVIMAHDQLWRFHGHTNQKVRGYGGYGVDLFFAISGVLICGRILEDEAVLGRFHLKDFYIRRFFRIQPAAWAYLATVALLMVSGIAHERWHFWLGALGLYQNFLFHSSRFTQMITEGYFTGHFWTLAVEEHFYILLSVFLFFVRRYRIAALTAIYVLLLAAQAWCLHAGWYSVDVSERRTYWQLQWLLWPALAAMLLRVPRIHAGAMRYLRPWVAFAFTLASMFAHHRVMGIPRSFWRPSSLSFDRVPLFFCFTLWIVATMLHPASWSTRVLEWQPLRYLGRISYSIYLWHLLFFAATDPFAHITWPPLVAMGQRPWCYGMILLTAMASYHWLEKPMMRLGHRLAPPATPGHRDLAAAPAFQRSAHAARAAVEQGGQPLSSAEGR